MKNINQSDSQFSSKILKTTMKEIKNHMATKLPLDNKITELNNLYLDLFKFKAHIGSKDWNKDMATYLLGSRNKISIIDLKLTMINLRRVLNFLEFFSEQTRILPTKSHGTIDNLNDGQLHYSGVSLPATKLPTTLLPKTSLLSDEINQIDTLSLGNKVANKAPTSSKIIKQKIPHVLFINTSNKFSELLKQVAFETKQSYINERWVGGTLTNWKQSSESLFLYNKFRVLFNNFLKITNIQIPVYQKLQKRYGGIHNRVLDLNDLGNKVDRSALPDVIILINPEENTMVIHEAQLFKIPIIAFTDSNTPIKENGPKNFSKRFPGIDFVIPGNNKSLSFIYFCLNLITITLQKKLK